MKILAITILLFLTIITIGIEEIDAYHICTPNNPEDCAGPLEGSGPPHMAGANTFDNDRVRFEPVAFESTFTMTNTEIIPILVPATNDYVRVWFDGILIETLDLGTAPTGNPHDTWRSIGNEPIKIPFYGYYEVDETGYLFHKGKGYQHVMRDFENTYYENPEKTIQRQIQLDKLVELLPHLTQSK